MNGPPARILILSILRKEILIEWASSPNINTKYPKKGNINLNGRLDLILILSILRKEIFILNVPCAVILILSILRKEILI